VWFEVVNVEEVVVIIRVVSACKSCPGIKQVLNIEEVVTAVRIVSGCKAVRVFKSLRRLQFLRYLILF